jgi:BirA family biotin operon repressor/biotin-[acetyl-CoA-carboxylase] ligase
VKRQILQYLRQADGVLSGEQMSDRLGVSRVSVWKHIRSLQSAGYPIESTPKGYRLNGRPDLLQPWEFEGREARIHCHDEVPSTMAIARNLARKGCPAFTVVTAERQIEGRGRLGRVWHSRRGGLYFTIVLRPTLPSQLSSLTTFAAGLTWARVLQKDYGVDAGLKWPNDLLVDERKLSGMLSEMDARGELVTFVNIGIGINVNNDPTPDEPRAVSLRQILGRTVDRRDLLEQFLNRFEEKMADDGWLDTVIAEWKPLAVTLNRRVRIVTTRETIEGLARDVDETGALILEKSDGVLQRVIHGDCFHQPASQDGDNDADEPSAERIRIHAQ